MTFTNQQLFMLSTLAGLAAGGIVLFVTHVWLGLGDLGTILAFAVGLFCGHLTDPHRAYWQRERHVDRSLSRGSL